MISVFIIIPFNTLSSQWRFFGKKDNTAMHELVPENYEIYINPQIDKVDKKSTQKGDEGCLSIPNLSLELERYDEIKVRYYNAKGRRIKKPLSGFLSRLFQHELDHLNGNLMLQHENIFDAGMWAEDDVHKNLLMKLMEYLNK